MDPVTLIVTALATGTASALQDDAKSGVQAALARLRALAGRRLSSRPAGELVLAQHEQAPDAYDKPLEHELAQSGAAADAELVGAAGELLKLLDPRGAAAGKYNVTVTGSSGVQVGDHNTQVNHFGEVSAGRDVYHAGRDITINPGDRT
jgi:RIP homotypic interaction motif